ncbi:Clan CA, family C1, cathepsin B-like cysteine peptidase [Tritrichomonas foetus]|uniref:Clan CA, family C1, cathepsin B-like cysteine peptidase n=1 Tax=Tritrichomonas foetus TaxID=1144522 RepID=A0A1J4L104_9EUKA|nr:Clan CA, family C1, cathepsin B-like cysteine peptidase [Tritrichomonas foetus]|eukprot:OHT15557.1 Clan CA, family C1, cathepsin B-like cysteine peptidase [Tritrichomonas foetus]
MLFFIFMKSILCTNDAKKKTTSPQLPKRYDFLKEFPHCNFGPLMQQCGSCYAYSTLKAMSHRFCRALGKRIQLSPQYLVACDLTNNGCLGGSEINAYYFLEQNGVTDISCHPWKNVTEYSDAFCSKCSTNKNMILYKAKYLSTKHVYGVEEIKKELYSSGPLTINVAVDNNFRMYKSGIYQSSLKKLPEAGNHSIELIGWGKKNGVPFWIGYNQYGLEWGINGRIYIRMGTNEALVESFAYASEPDLSNFDLSKSHEL